MTDSHSEVCCSKYNYSITVIKLAGGLFPTIMNSSMIDSITLPEAH